MSLLYGKPITTHVLVTIYIQCIGASLVRQIRRSESLHLKFPAEHCPSQRSMINIVLVLAVTTDFDPVRMRSTQRALAVGTHEEQLTPRSTVISLGTASTKKI